MLPAARACGPTLAFAFDRGAAPAHGRDFRFHRAASMWRSISFWAVFTASSLAQSLSESPIPTAPGWRAAQIHKSEQGVWYAHVAAVVPAHGAADVIATNDKGQLLLLSVYSGNWTVRAVNPDGQWLAPSQPADVDPRVAGAEIYVAGKGGNVHRVTRTSKPFGQFALDSVEIGHVAGEEFHTVLAADLLPAHPGDELLVFGLSGAVYELRAAEQPGDAFDMRLLARIDGRVRDAVVLPAVAGEPPWLVGASRSGHLLGMRLGEDRLETRELAREQSGLGRVARRPAVGAASGEVVYATRDDGVLLRFEQQADGTWQREVIFVGAQGLRGVAAGRFFADGREAVAVYGYGRKVQLVSRQAAGPWQVETILTTADQGHWLAVGELDGRNSTDELIATGFGGQVLLIGRAVGYGLGDAAVDAEPGPPPGAIGAATPSTRPWRIAARIGEAALRELSPLSYQGGFESKALVYETLVRRGPDGRIVPGLCDSWRIDEGGKLYSFTLREGAAFHDGSRVTAQDVAVHFRRWVGLPEHDWLPSNARIQQVEAIDERTLRVRLDRPTALLPDLCAINPTAIRGPAALDREGRFVRPVGSGPFALVGAQEGDRVLRYRRQAAQGGGLIDLLRLGAGEDAVAALLAGEVDAVLSGWLVRVDAARVRELQRDARFRVVEGPGSVVTLLALRCSQGPTADRDLRRHIAAAVDRAALIDAVECGLADACTGFAAPSVTIWPQGQPRPPTGAVPALVQPLRLQLAGNDPLAARLAAQLAAQLTTAGLPTEVIQATAKGTGDWDLRLEETHGVPYDPYLTAVRRFLPPPQRSAAAAREVATTQELAAMAQQITCTADEAARCALYKAMQEQLDGEVLLVPLFARRRVAIVRTGMPVPSLDHDMYRLDPSWLASGG